MFKNGNFSKLKYQVSMEMQPAVTSKKASPSPAKEFELRPEEDVSPQIKRTNLLYTLNGKNGSSKKKSKALNNSVFLENGHRKEGLSKYKEEEKARQQEQIRADKESKNMDKSQSGFKISSLLNSMENKIYQIKNNLFK